jgi:hypothetical protein
MRCVCWLFGGEGGGGLNRRGAEDAELGWEGVSNGELLRRAEGEFDLLITADRKLRHQQNLKRRTLALLVLPSNRLKVLRGMLADIEGAVAKVEPGKPEQYFELAWTGE